jgi:hypothetical protein
MDDAWIPIIGMICVFGLPMAGWITSRVLRHRERMAMLERGMMPPPDLRRYQRRGAADWAPPPPSWNAGAPPVYPYEDPNSPQCLLRKGIITAAVGIALLIGLSFIGYHPGDGLMDPPHWHPGPWLLGGLIPMFVGFAQVAIAVLSGAQMVGLRGPDLPPNPMPPPGGNSRYTSPPQPGRPGSRYEELARPVPPPDRQ